jgi:nucleoside-diphosphate-sugar epimerase
MRIVVTGGSGHVGRRIVRLLSVEHEVVNIDLRAPTDERGAYVRADIMDGPAIRRAFAGVDAVVHAAAVPGPAFGTKEDIERINIWGTREVAGAATAEGVRRLVFISSEAVLGLVFSGDRTRPRYFPIDEAHPLSPTEPYGGSKLAAEAMLERAARSGPTVVCFRPPWVWVPEEYARCRELTTNPETWRDGLWAYVHGDDLARAVSLAITREISGRFYSVYIAAPDNGTVFPTRELLAKFYPGVPLTREIPEFGSLIASDGITRLLGFRPQMSWRRFLK